MFPLVDDDWVAASEIDGALPDRVADNVQFAGVRVPPAVLSTLFRSVSAGPVLVMVQTMKSPNVNVTVLLPPEGLVGSKALPFRVHAQLTA